MYSIIGLWSKASRLNLFIRISDFTIAYDWPL